MLRLSRKEHGGMTSEVQGSLMGSLGKLTLVFFQKGKCNHAGSSDGNCEAGLMRDGRLRMRRLGQGQASCNEESRGFPGGASGKKPTCQCRRPNRCGLNPRREGEDPLEEGMATHSSILA